MTASASPPSAAPGSPPPGTDSPAVTPSPRLRDVLVRVGRGEALSAREAEEALRIIMAGEATAVQMAAFLMGLQARGHTADEVAGGVRALREAMVALHVSGDGGPLIDTCGMGGGTVTTFNISTAAALVAAGAGARVAKHGNRSFTSRSGSADVLEALGIRIQLSPREMETVLGAAGIVFMFAPLLHPAMRHVGPVRRELGVPTIMNLLGPLTNPAGVRRQVVGVSDPALVPLVAEALRDLGHLRALVVHGAPGLDEVSPLGPTWVAELADGEIRTSELDPIALGLPPTGAEALAGGTPQENARIIEGILSGEIRNGARTVVLLNAAAALRVADLASTWEEALQMAAEVVDQGRAWAALERLRVASAAGTDAGED